MSHMTLYQETWADMDKESESTSDDHHVTPTPEEIAAKNASVIEAMKKNVQMFRNMHDTNNNLET